MSAAESQSLGSLAQGLTELGHAADQTAQTILALATDATRTPDRLGHAVALLTVDGQSEHLRRITIGFAMLLLCAIGSALIVRRVLAARRHRLAGVTANTAGQFALELLRSLAVDAAPIAAFVGIGGGLLLFWERQSAFLGSDVFKAVASTIIGDAAMAWLAIVVLSLPLGVGRPGLRCVPLDDGEAAAIGRFIVKTAVIGAASWIAAASLDLMQIGEGVPRLLMMVAGIIICAMSLHALARIRSRLGRFAKIYHALAAASVFGLGIGWVVGILHGGAPPYRPVLLTILILAALPTVDGMAALLLERLRQRLIRSQEPAQRIYRPSSDPEGEALTAIERMPDRAQCAAIDVEMARSTDALAGVEQEAVRWALAITAALLLADAWSPDLYPLLPQWAHRVPGSLAEAALTLLIGWYAWRLFETGIAVKLSRDGGEMQSRARTVQPLLRAIGKFVIGAVALMTAFASLGLNIAPLLASAGVVGIAVGFGAQTLMRDLFSGASYLIEDVFRIGDYIECGNAKGTVERIMFRTLALRHQNGPLHFVPYGSLGSVRNNSRDWVIDKFELPFPVTVDSERVRKLVKQIGIEMLDDPEVAGIIDTPLKAKLYRIEPGIKVFRCKVQTPPGRQFEVRSEAFRRIELALKENGIDFADNSMRLALCHAPSGPAFTSATPVPETGVGAIADRSEAAAELRREDGAEATDAERAAKSRCRGGLLERPWSENHRDSAKFASVEQ